MENRSLVTIAEHSREKILYMLEMAKQFEKNPNRRLLEGKVVATLFFEPSTRTRLSFETAANRLGARVIGFSDPKATSSSKGETLKDTIMMVSNYADVIVMRHYLEGAARYASEVAPVPIVNAGDGANQHPSQTMLDLYSIYKTQGTLCFLPFLTAITSGKNCKGPGRNMATRRIRSKILSGPNCCSICFIPFDSNWNTEFVIPGAMILENTFGSS